MLRPKPRMTGGMAALTASAKRKPPLPYLGGLAEAKTPLRELRAAVVILPCIFFFKKKSSNLKDFFTHVRLKPKNTRVA
jgi:hypothetical protein